MSNFQNNSIITIDAELRGYLLRDFLEKNGLREEVNNNIVYGTYTTMEEMDGIGGGLSEVKHEGGNYLGKGLEKNPFAPVLKTKPTVMDNAKLQLFVCDRYGILTKEDFFKSLDELQTKLSDQFITRKIQERERVMAQMAKLQEQLRSIDADIENAKGNNRSPRR